MPLRGSGLEVPPLIGGHNKDWHVPIATQVKGRSFLPSESRYEGILSKETPPHRSPPEVIAIVVLGTQKSLQRLHIILLASCPGQSRPIDTFMGFGGGGGGRIGGGGHAKAVGNSKETRKLLLSRGATTRAHKHD